MRWMNVKTLSVYRSSEGIIVERKNEFGTRFKSVFETTEAMLECLNGYKLVGNIDQYELEVSEEFWATVINFLSTGKMPNSHGGRRVGAGRPSLGTTKKVSLTLPDEIWEEIERQMETKEESRSAILRTLIANRFEKEIMLVPIEKDLLEQIQSLSENTNEMYEEMEPETIVHNILNAERLRLKKLQ